MVSAADETPQEVSAEAPVEAEATKEEAPKTRPLDYVMVKHLGYSPKTKVHRAARAGQRRQRLMLDTGRRIRFKGERFTEVSLTDLFKNFNTLLASVRSGAAEICRPDNLQPFTHEQLLDLGHRLAEDYKKDLKVDETLLEPLFADLTDKRVWEAKPSEPTEGVITPEAPKAQITEPAPEPIPEEPSQDESRQEEPTAQGEEVVITEEDLHKKSRGELNELASNMGVEEPEKLPNKQAVIDAILDASEAQE